MKCPWMHFWLALLLPAAAQAARPPVRSVISAVVGRRVLAANPLAGTTRSGVTWYRESNTLILSLTTWPSADDDYRKYDRLSFSVANFTGKPGTYRLVAGAEPQAMYAPAGASDSGGFFTSGACPTPAFVVVVAAYDSRRHRLRGTFAGRLCSPDGKKSIAVSTGKFDCQYTDWDEFMKGTGK